ncbi:MAG: glycosyltransferase [Aquificota bacterium]|nr:glycosyltransferase [Aquificota bacterium]
MKIAFLKAGDLRGSLGHIRALIDYLEGKGVEVAEIDLKPDRVQEAVNRVMDIRPAFTLDLNGTGIIVGDQEGKKMPLYDILGFVHISYFTEDPLLHFPAIYGLQHRNFIGVVGDLRYAESLKLLGIENMSYVTPFLDFERLPEPEPEKDIDVAFLGPVIDPQIVTDSVKRNLPENIFPVFIETGEFMFRNPEVGVVTAFSYVLSLFNPQYQEEVRKWSEENKEAFFRLLNDISIYATMRKRWYLINFLEGINLKIVGDYQGELKEDHENIKVDSYEELLKVYSRTLLTVVCFPNTVPSGIGYTPLEVSAMGSALMIDYRGTLPGFLKPGEEVITYMPLDRADIEEKVLYYLDNPEEAREIGERAREVVRERFRVDDRGEFLYNMMNDILSKATQEKKE